MLQLVHNVIALTLLVLVPMGQQLMDSRGDLVDMRLQREMPCAVSSIQ